MTSRLAKILIAAILIAVVILEGSVILGYFTTKHQDTSLPSEGATLSILLFNRLMEAM